MITASVGVVLATGAAPVRRPIPGLAEAGYWINREAIEATEPPESLVVLGGGAIGIVSASSRGFIHGLGNNGLIKLVCDADRAVLVGATAVGSRGGEVLSMLTLAVHARLPVSTLRSMIYAYPTFHRGVLDALAALS
ncbi:MAG: FAD-dependent oxidoreductase [Pseudonocardiaceae bacterium]